MLVKINLTKKRSDDASRVSCKDALRSTEHLSVILVKLFSIKDVQVDVKITKWNLKNYCLQLNEITFRT